LKALALDDNLAEAHASLGQITEYYDYDFVTAEREYRRAIELNPNYATAHQWLAEHLCALKRNDEGVAEIRRALELDPMSVIINRTLGDILADQRKLDEAIQQYQKTLELDPNFPTAHYFLARAYEAKGSYDEAVKEYDASSRHDPVLAGTLDTANDIYKKSGWKAYVQFILEQLVNNNGTRKFPAFVIATFYAKADRPDEAIKWLGKGYEERDFRMTKLSGAFEFDSLRSDPRFRELLRRMGLPE
jgi:tetratricopeptide (TPR) repeat protein